MMYRPTISVPKCAELYRAHRAYEVNGRISSIRMREGLANAKVKMAPAEVSCKAKMLC